MFQNLFAILLALCSTITGAQTDRLHQNNTSYLRTVLLQRSDLEMSMPIIKIGSGDQLVLRFDDLRSGVHDYSYTFEHCNQDWTTSGLFPLDYLDGFEEQFISDYAFSFNTKQSYTQYRAVFPNDQLNFLVSGNYLIHIWESGNDSAPVLTLPFYVREELATIQASVQQPNLTRFRNDYQRLLLEVGIKEVPSSNPFDEVRVSVIQNFRENQPLTNIKPRLIANNTMLFDQTDLVFPGGKEFRRFDIRSTRVQSERIVKMDRTQTGTDAWINVDQNRSYQRYAFDNDVDGQFLIDADMARNKHLDADYVMVHFALESPFWMSQGDYFVVGGFNHYQTGEENRMEYDADLQQYTCQIYLKQGYYNYLYTFLEHGSNIQDYSMAEGNYFETENNYQVMIYLHDNMRNADRLIGYSSLTSFPR